MSTIREQFEQAARAKGINLTLATTGEYAFVAADHAWWAWQAAVGIPLSTRCESPTDEKPIDRAARTGEPDLFSHAPDRTSVRVVWPDGKVILYEQEAQDAEPVSVPQYRPKRPADSPWTDCIKGQPYCLPDGLYEVRTLFAAPPSHKQDATAAIREAILTYYDDLSARKHGGVAQDKAFNAIQEALGMSWQAGVDHRAAAKPNADCSGEPANCPDNEGYGCACDPMNKATRSATADCTHDCNQGRACTCTCSGLPG